MNDITAWWCEPITTEALLERKGVVGVTRGTDLILFTPVDLIWIMEEETTVTGFRLSSIMDEMHGIRVTFDIPDPQVPAQATTLHLPKEGMLHIGPGEMGTVPLRRVTEAIDERTIIKT